MKKKRPFGPFAGVVEEVHDGDTVHMKIDLGFDLTVYARVRAKGINAPELATDPGKSARDFARTLLPVGAPVLVTSFGWDKYGGRIDGEIVFGEKLDRDFSWEMVFSGHAESVAW